MKESLFITASEVATTLNVSKQMAYKIIREMNSELRKKGFLVVRGKVDRKYFNDHLYGRAS